MPPRVKVCNVSGCPHLTTGRLCEAHETARRKTTDKARGSSSSRGYDSSWRRTRGRYLQLHPTCESCSSSTATEVDHIIPMSSGGDKHSHSNLQALCKSCHSRKTTTADGGFGRRS